MSAEDSKMTNLGIIEMPKMTNDWIEWIFERANCHFEFNVETSCFERFYVKQPVHKDPIAFVALCLKKIKPVGSLHDPKGVILQRCDMYNAEKNLVIYDMSPFLRWDKNNDGDEPEYDNDNVDELLLLKQFPDMKRIV